MAKLAAFGCVGLRAFDRPTEVETARFTVIFGANNSGKTTLVRLPSFAAHSARHPDRYALEGNSLEFGSGFRDLCSGNDPHPELEYWLRSDVGDVVHYKLAMQTVSLEEHVYVESKGHSNSDSGGEYSIAESALANWNPIHLGSQRPDYAPVFAYREPGIISGASAPYLLATSVNTERIVREWIEQTFPAHSLNIWSETNSFCLMGDRAGTLNFSRVGRGLQAVTTVAAMVAYSATRPTPQTLLIEEPEAHVHPGAHGALADLMIEKGEGTQFVVETHSENFLLRLRRRIAEGRLNKEDLALYYVNNRHKVERIQVDRHGMVETWPRGVFQYDVDEAEAILAARIESQR